MREICLSGLTRGRVIPPYSTSESLRLLQRWGKHQELNATMVDFDGWEMPVHYPDGIVHEHLSTRKHAGIFDVSHMGRFTVAGENALLFLQHVLTRNAAALDVGESQYTLIPTYSGGVMDDRHQRPSPKSDASTTNDDLSKANALIGKSIENTRWRTIECISLIPSEQTPSTSLKAGICPPNPLGH